MGPGPRPGMPTPQGPNSWPIWPDEGPMATTPSPHSGRAQWLLLPDHLATDLAAAGWGVRMTFSQGPEGAGVPKSR